jgi:hypothetical protein
MTNMYFGHGRVIKKMVTGLGIGGIMSPVGAAACCISYEDKWQSSIWRDLKGPIRGARLVDDLPMIINYRDFPMVHKMQTDCYPEPIELEMDGPPGCRTRCFECEVQIRERKGVTVVAYNKNEESIVQNGTMRFRRYPHWDSYCPRRIKTAFIKGTMHRYVGNTSPNAYREQLWKPIWIFILELKNSRYPWGYIEMVFKSIEMHWLPVHPSGFQLFARMWKCLVETIREHRYLEQSRQPWNHTGLDVIRSQTRGGLDMVI